MFLTHKLNYLWTLYRHLLCWRPLHQAINQLFEAQSQNHLSCQSLHQRKVGWNTLRLASQVPSSWWDRYVSKEDASHTSSDCRLSISRKQVLHLSDDFRSMRSFNGKNRSFNAAQISQHFRLIYAYTSSMITIATIRAFVTSFIANRSHRGTVLHEATSTEMEVFSTCQIIWEAFS